MERSPDVAEGEMVSGNFFSGLGVKLARGRGFTEQDEASHAPVGVISDSYWTRRFARNPEILGQTLVCERRADHDCGHCGGGL